MVSQYYDTFDNKQNDDILARLDPYSYYVNSKSKTWKKKYTLLIKKMFFSRWIQMVRTQSVQAKYVYLKYTDYIAETHINLSNMSLCVVREYSFLWLQKSQIHSCLALLM